MDNLKEILDREAARVHIPEFVANDPVQFPRRFDRLPDVEIVALLSSQLAWGNRKMICRDIERLLGLIGPEPERWLLGQAYEEIADEQNIHRTFFGRNLKHLCRGLREAYRTHGTLDRFCAATGAPLSASPAWHLAAALNQLMARANGGVADPRCLPTALHSSALKRLNMALRWLVRRDDGIVDLGLWESLSPAQLFIPLDTHVAQTARKYGLLTRRANDRRAVEEITAHLRKFRPDDPTYYDFALFALL